MKIIKTEFFLEISFAYVNQYFSCKKFFSIDDEKKDEGKHGKNKLINIKSQYLKM